MPWNAAIICEGETEIEAVGSSPDEAVLNMLADIMEFWRKDEWTLCGDYIKEIGEAIVALERADKNCEFESQCGDFAAPWKLVVTWIEPAECDQIGSGCTCESCQRQLSTALGMMEPVDLDPRIPDDADDCKPVRIVRRYDDASTIGTIELTANEYAEYNRLADHLTGAIKLSDLIVIGSNYTPSEVIDTDETVWVEN